MKVSGFTIIRNGVSFDYPFEESIRSLLPLVDELIINVGESTDSTLEFIQKLAEAEKKIQYFVTPWPLNQPDKMREGCILSEQTNLALNRCTGDWCFYLQADEILHEADSEKIKTALKKYDSRSQIEGLLFDYIHFYGSFNVIQDSRSAYRREVRLIRRASEALSIGDAQSFRKPSGEKLSVAHSHARIFHYGWVRPPEKMKEKTFFMDQLYHGKADPDSRLPHTGNNYQYKRFWGLKPYSGSHPKIMQPRIEKKGWNWDLKNSQLIWTFQDVKKMTLDTLERLTGIRLFEYRSYRLKK